MKIYYTPYISKQEEDFIIPESAFLNPIKLSQEVVKEVIPEVVEKEEVKPRRATNSDLIWAREKTKQNPVTWERVVEENWPVKEMIDYDDIKERQKYAESAGNAKAVSKAGAKGLYQIMNPTHKDYIEATGDVGDLFDPVYNEKVRDYYMDWLSKSKVISADKSSKQVALIKQLIAYNWGIGNLKNHLIKKKDAGIDIYNSLDWIDESIPKETRDYINFIAFKKGTGSRSEEAYQRYKMKLG